MHKLFGQPVDVRDPCHPMLASFAKSTVATDRVIAENVQFEPCVTAQRDAEFRKSAIRLIRKRSGAVGGGGGQPSPHLFLDALTKYYYDRVAFTQRPDYLDPALNGPHLVAGGPGRPAVSGQTMLASVIDLNRCADGPFAWARTRGSRPRFASFPLGGPDPDGAVSRWIGLQVTAAGRGAPGLLQREFVEDVCHVLNEYRWATSYLTPMWATTWSAFGIARTGRAERWAQAMGRNKPVANHWLMVVKYSVAEAGEVACPSQLDAGPCPCHFPLPTAMSQGHPMDLLERPKPRALLPHFVHAQIDLQLKHWLDAGEMLELTSQPVHGPTPAQRANHLLLLSQRYGSAGLPRAWP